MSVSGAELGKIPRYKHYTSDTDGSSLTMSINPIHAIHTISLLPLLSLSLNRKRPQSLQADSPECTLLRSLKVDLRDSAPRDAAALEGSEGLQPSAGAKAPLAALAEAHGPEVVALARRVVEEVLGYHARQSVVPLVHHAGAAVSIAMETCHRLC